MDIQKTIKLLLENPANNMTTTSRDLLETMGRYIKHGLFIENGAIMKSFKEYNDLGYDVCFTTILGKDAIKMTKRWDHENQRPITCEQMFHADENPDKVESVLTYMFKDIQKQSETKKFYEPSISYYAKS